MLSRVRRPATLVLFHTAEHAATWGRVQPASTFLLKVAMLAHPQDRNYRGVSSPTELGLVQ
jgi:hypothetical protein